RSKPQSTPHSPLPTPRSSGAFWLEVSIVTDAHASLRCDLSRKRVIGKDHGKLDREFALGSAPRKRTLAPGLRCREDSGRAKGATPLVDREQPAERALEPHFGGAPLTLDAHPWRHEHRVGAGNSDSQRLGRFVHPRDAEGPPLHILREP